MKFELDPFNRNVTNEELISDLKRVALELQKSALTIKDYKQIGKYHNTTFSRRFGSWLEALEKAGLNKTKYHNISDEELFYNLEEVWVKLGKQPHYSDMQIPLSKYSAKGYVRRFGSWQKALEGFVSYINNQKYLGYKPISQPKSMSKHKTSRNINWQLRFVVMKRDNFKCRSCGRSPATDSKIILHVDHVNPWSKGWETVLNNLQTLCSICNIGKSNLI